MRVDADPLVPLKNYERRAASRGGKERAKMGEAAGRARGPIGRETKFRLFAHMRVFRFLWQ